jgi:isopentenyl-diphosphate delta-isomerase
MEMLIRVDSHDQEVGTVEKMLAHREGILHRAFSVFLFTSDGRWILQQRALHKYHSGGLWSNSCCGHPNPGEETVPAAEKRLQFEMGLSCSLKPAFSFKYKASLDHGLTEHEYDHVFLGETNAEPVINLSEVASWMYMDIVDIRNSTEHFTPWFNMVFERVHALRHR